MKNKILFVVIAGLFTAGIASASLGEYWSTISHLIPRTNDTVDIGTTVKRVRALFTNDLTFYDEIKPDNATCANGEILKRTGANNWDCAADATGAGGSAIIFDIGDDGGNDSTDVNEIATTGDTNTIFTEPSADKILIAVGNNWPTADTATTASALVANPTDCGANQFAQSIIASGNLTCSAIGDADVPNDITIDLATLASSVTNATLTTALTVNTGTLTLTGNVANSSVLTIGAGAVSVSGANTGDQNLSGYWDADGDVAADEISESKIAFSTACGAGNHYYLNGNDLACEANTTDTTIDGCINCLNATEIEDIYTLNSGDTMTGILTVTETSAGALQTQVRYLNSSNTVGTGGRLSFRMLDSNSAVQTYGRVGTEIDVATAGSEDGTMRLSVIGGGAFGDILILDGSSKSATFAGAITGTNLSGSNTGDQDISSYMQDTDIDTFAELQSWVTDETLLKAGTLTDTKLCTWDSANGDIVCNTAASGFDSTTIDATTWSDNANASNIWTFDVSGTDHTMTFGSGLVTLSHGLTVTGTLTGTLTGNASTATALADNGGNCAAGQAPLGVDASGAVESCFDVWTEAENTAAGYTSNAGDVTQVFDCASGDCNTMTVGTSEYLTYGTGYIDANRFAGVTTVDATEFGYLNGVTSAIQTQLTAKWDELTDMILTDTYIYVGDGSNDPVGVAMSGDCTISNTGAITCDHDALDNFVANEHLDWTADLGAVNIHAGNYTDNNTTYVSSDWTLSDITGYVANEHLDWTADLGATNIHAGNYTDTNTTYVSSDFTHNDLTGYEANRHLDWTVDLGATNIHSGNYTAGLTNLTDFDQTAWRLFYSNNLGDVIELSLGTDGQYLKSQGGTSSLTWGTPTDTTANETITLSGDVAGSGETAITTTIGANKILESHLKAVDAAADEECLTYEATTGDFEWQECGAGGGASVALDNLASVAINTSLLSDTDNTDDLGSSTFEWKDIFIDGIAYIDSLFADIAQLGGATNYINIAAGGIMSFAGTSAIDFGNANEKTGKFEAFDAAESHTLNITGVVGNNPIIRGATLYIEDDPGADANVICRLSFYNSDSVTEDELIKDYYFNLTYTETNGGASATDTTDAVDDISGLVKYDLIRYLGGTAENVRLTAAPTGTTLTFSALANAHADNTGIARVAELTNTFQVYDADSTNEIHMKLEMLSDPGTAVDVVIDLDIQ